MEKWTKGGVHGANILNSGAQTSMVTPIFYFMNYFDKSTIFNLCKKNQRISMFRFFINSIKSCGESITGPEEHTQIESILEHKVIKNALKYIFLTRR